MKRYKYRRNDTGLEVGLKELCDLGKVTSPL